MDYDDLDELNFDPKLVALRRYLKFFSFLLLATFVLPIDRANGSPVNVWDRFGVDDTLTIIRLMMPALVGLSFLLLGWLSSFNLKVTSALTTGLLLLMIVLGINPLEIMRVAVPPLSGNWADNYFGTVAGSYFPREDTLHLFLLGAGLVCLGIGGRYTGLLNSSRYSRWVSTLGVVLLLGYYLFPYGGRIPIERNVDLYKSYYAFSSETAELGQQLEEQSEDLDSTFKNKQVQRTIMKKRISNMKNMGRLRLTAVYYASVYFVPLLLLLLMLPALKKARYRGHNISFARAVGWGATIYLLAFLFPLLVKESMRVTGPGFLGNLRSYIIFSAVFLGLSVAASSFLIEMLERNSNDEHLPDNPLMWTEEDA
ncbi:MAG TPA: hypothetical protein EYN06_02655 [Myxococcales bacterium]|nr:hypothetical protein [Myxococcales bacterium]HIN85354.1 hypothetical protein [Myxococcales bacterium]